MTTYLMNWGVFFDELPGGGERYWQLIVSGIGWTLAVSACAWVIALVLGSVIGTIRTTDRPWLVQFGNAWVEFSVLCLGLFTSARVAEQVRAGIQSLARGQRMAGMAIGLTQPQVYRYVLLPMGFRIIIPPLTSETMNLIKNSSIALTIGLPELTFRARELGEYTFNFFEAFTAATLIYIAIAMTANRVMALIERRASVPGYIIGGK